MLRKFWSLIVEAWNEPAEPVKITYDRPALQWKEYFPETFNDGRRWYLAGRPFLHFYPDTGLDVAFNQGWLYEYWKDQDSKTLTPVDDSIESELPETL